MSFLGKNLLRLKFMSVAVAKTMLKFVQCGPNFVVAAAFQK